MRLVRILDEGVCQERGDDLRVVHSSESALSEQVNLNAGLLGDTYDNDVLRSEGDEDAAALCGDLPL